MIETVFELRHGDVVTNAKRLFVVRTVLSDAMGDARDPIEAALVAHRDGRELAYLVDITPAAPHIIERDVVHTVAGQGVTIEGRAYIIRDGQLKRV